MKNESGRTMIEIIAVLVIMGVLSVTGVIWYMNAMYQQKVDAILNAVQMKTIEINSALSGKSFTDIDEKNRFLAEFKGFVNGYMLSFHASTDDDGFVTEISYLNQEPIKGRMCRDLITKMAKQRFVSDVDFTLKNEEKEDGTKGDITVRLNGQYIDLNAVCGG